MKEEVDNNHLIDIFKEASIKLSPDRCGNLVFTQKKYGKLIIREPEATHSLALVLSKRNIDFGLAVPTKEKYNFSGKKPDHANIDLAIEPYGKQINIELKTQSGGIEKDFKKMLKENVIGCAFLHILKNSKRKTLPELLKKYSEAYTKAYTNITDSKSKWFLLFIFTKEKKECCWKVFDDITKISHVEFNLNEFSKC